MSALDPAGSPPVGRSVNRGRQQAAEPAKPGFFGRAFRRLMSSTEDLESENLQRTVRETGSTPIKSCTDRARVSLIGTINTVTLHPRDGKPALEVEVRDGSGTVTLVWLGRRRIPGIDPGRSISVSGRISCNRGQRTLYNPKYELLDDVCGS